MNNLELEDKLIYPNIADVLADYVSIQEDITEQNCKSASLIAQNIDLKRLVGVSNLKRIISVDDYDLSAADLEFKELITPPLCYYTYYRLLTGFNGTYTDSGYTREEAAIERNAAKSQANEMKSIGDEFMVEVMDFLKEENPETPADKDKIKKNVRVFGGKENRASN